MKPPPKDLLLFKRCLNALDAESESYDGWQRTAEKCPSWYELRAELRERLKDNDTISKSWRKEPPDVPGMWLAAFWKDGRWWTEILHVHQHGIPRRADETWWYMGPVELPNETVKPESAPPPGYALEITLKGETPQELWNSLLDLTCYACECKHRQEGKWPYMVSTDAGKIVVRHNDKLRRGEQPASENQ